MKGSLFFSNKVSRKPGAIQTHRLKRFELHGIVTRTAYAETPPRVVYELTPLGEGLRVLEAMGKWGYSLPDDATSNESPLQW
ncbi:helix-turn-helix transcriptional regulator [Aeromonas veronii]|nr:helix-turn-helix transcriptional regulator [Aeromonas hydrophila]EKP0249894.1 helix-turn-helix transcriptional regulator [Aeromonas veronii]TNI79553.1 hypothetical protein CF119_19780 [Aeromonas sobria]HAT1511562.1 helix-turn-helix transcriptional regulator [Aeromonas hydrophila]HAT1519089.1 helix-turn-helix transcriptional regulator [Aeromonas hydrophila]